MMGAFCDIIKGNRVSLANILLTGAKPAFDTHTILHLFCTSCHSRVQSWQICQVSHWTRLYVCMTSGCTVVTIRKGLLHKTEPLRNKKKLHDMFTITHKNVTSWSARTSDAHCHDVKFASNECPRGNPAEAVISLRIGVLRRPASSGRAIPGVELEAKGMCQTRQRDPGLSNSVCFLTLCVTNSRLGRNNR